MILAVGLGNPGKKFTNTRHNLGFLIIDEFQEKNKFPDFRLSKKFNALISEGILNGKKILLVKPQTFMNLSGRAVKKIVSSFKFQVSSLWVVHDDIDLPLGKIKIVKNRGAAGHKGVGSIIKELGTKNFVRFRLGIKPQKIENRKQKIEKFVLMKFTKDEEVAVKETIQKAIEAIEFSLKEGVEKTMSLYNK